MPTKQGGAAADGLGTDALREGLPHLLPVGTLVGAVLGVLILGAVLQSEEPSTAAAPRAVAAAEARSPDRTAAAGSEASSRIHGLARRVEQDLERMAAPGDGWTAQLALLCDPSRVQQILDRFGSQRPLHILPTFHNDDACFLVCWNRYPTSERAKKASDLPAALRSVQPKPLPKEIAKILQ